MAGLADMYILPDKMAGLADMYLLPDKMVGLADMYLLPDKMAGLADMYLLALPLDRMESHQMPPNGLNILLYFHTIYINYNC